MFAAAVDLQWLQYGAAGLVLTVAVFVLRWTDAHQKEWLNTARARIEALEAETRLCEWRTEILLGVLRRAGLDVPAEYWSGPPPEQPKRSR